MRSDPTAPDEALVAAFAAKDERAAGMLYDRFASRIYGLGIVMLGNDQAAQDLVQDTFVKLWRTADRFDPLRGRVETWVLLVARSLAIDSIRRRVTEARSLERIGVSPEEDPSPGPDDRVTIVDLTERAQQAMDALSPVQRSALELAYFGGRTVSEVAALEGIPLGTAKTRIHSALLRLRGAMAEEAGYDV
jgi:RNA polymerase sigma-70 factor (ECF subfamily)